MAITGYDERMKAAEDALRKRRASTGQVRDLTGTRGTTAVVDSVEHVAKLLNAYVTKKEHKLDLDQVRDELKDLIDKSPLMVSKRTIEVVTQVGDVVGEIKGITHKTFELLVKAAHVVDRKGLHKNIMLKGPMGGGKSTAGKQLAELMTLPFKYLGQTEMPHDVVGFVHPVTNEYHPTAFTEAFVHGGIVMLEEMDAWSPRATLVVNVPLANGYIRLPNGEVHERHKDCVIIACTNTWGTGATAEYVGRNKLDAAFLDRFAVKIDWQYDEDMERAGADHDEVVDAVQKARFNATHHGIRVNISPRSSFDIADMVRSGFTIEEAMEMNFLAGCDREQRKMLLSN